MYISEAKTKVLVLYEAVSKGQREGGKSEEMKKTGAKCRGSIEP